LGNFKKKFWPVKKIPGKKLEGILWRDIKPGTPGILKPGEKKNV